jgi:hypothetical protein
METLRTMFAANSGNEVLIDIKLLFPTVGVVTAWDTPVMLRGPREGLIDSAEQGQTWHWKILLSGLVTSP